LRSGVGRRAFRGVSFVLRVSVVVSSALQIYAYLGEWLFDRGGDINDMHRTREGYKCNASMAEFLLKATDAAQRLPGSLSTHTYGNVFEALLGATFLARGRERMVECVVEFVKWVDGNVPTWRRPTMSVTLTYMPSSAASAASTDIISVGDGEGYEVVAWGDNADGSALVSDGSGSSTVDRVLVDKLPRVLEKVRMAKAAESEALQRRSAVDRSRCDDALRASQRDGVAAGAGVDGEGDGASVATDAPHAGTGSYAGSVMGSVAGSVSISGTGSGAGVPARDERSIDESLGDGGSVGGGSVRSGASGDGSVRSVAGKVSAYLQQAYLPGSYGVHSVAALREHSDTAVQVPWRSKKYSHTDPYFACCGVRVGESECLRVLWPDPRAYHTGALHIQSSRKRPGGDMQAGLNHVPRGRTPTWTCCGGTAVAPGCVSELEAYVRDADRYSADVARWMQQHDDMLSRERSLYVGWDGRSVAPPVAAASPAPPWAFASAAAPAPSHSQPQPSPQPPLAASSSWAAASASSSAVAPPAAVGSPALAGSHAPSASAVDGRHRAAPTASSSSLATPWEQRGVVHPSLGAAATASRKIPDPDIEVEL
jgi:hypothetical protein